MADIEEIKLEQKSKVGPPEINIASLSSKNQIKKFLSADDDIPHMKIHDGIHPNQEKKDFFGEKINQNDIDLISRNIQSDLDTMGYHAIPENSDIYKDIHDEMDIIAFKIVHINELLDFIHVVPIKISDLNGSLVISEDSIDYKSLTQEHEMNKAVKKILIGSKVKDLRQAHDLIFTDLINEGALFHFFKKYFKSDFIIEKTRTSKKLFFHSGLLQYKIIINPILACKNEPGFLEKLIPYAIQKRFNIHIIKSVNMIGLLSYLEQKNNLIETHSEQIDPINTYFRAMDKFFAELRLYSIPFVIYGFVFLLIIAFQVYPLIRLFVNLGYGALGIYISVLFYLYFKFFTVKSGIQNIFNTPYFLLPLKFDESSLILINEELSPELMAQFTYECLGKSINYEIIADLEEDRNLKRNSKNINKKHAFNRNTLRDLIVHKNIVQNNDTYRKYSSFLED